MTTDLNIFNLLLGPEHDALTPHAKVSNKFGYNNKNLYLLNGRRHILERVTLFESYHSMMLP